MRRRAAVLTATLAASPLLGMLGYSAVHEAGHAVVAVANGARVDRFVTPPTPCWPAARSAACSRGS